MFERMGNLNFFDNVFLKTDYQNFLGLVSISESTNCMQLVVLFLDCVLIPIFEYLVFYFTRSLASLIS